jgi:DNA-binding transcriptional regulator YdaS (Cro superfamily)
LKSAYSGSDNAFHSSIGPALYSRGSDKPSAGKCSIMGDGKRTSDFGRRKRVFDEREVLRMLRAAVEHEGSQMAFAKRHGLNRSNLNLVLSGKRPVTDSVARPLGLCRLYVADEDEVLRMLRAAVEREGGQSVFARRHGLDRSNLNLVLSSKRPVTDAVVRPLGLCRLYVKTPMDS